MCPFIALYQPFLTFVLFFAPTPPEDIMSNTERVWELMKKIGICMLASWDGEELKARPMGAYARPDEHAVFFLADARHHK